MDPVSSEPQATGGDLTIGQLADLAGVSARAVRHYHSIGLLPEPARDSSGYRRYGGVDVVALVRIVRLRALGMPLPQIAERMADGTESLRESLTALADEVDGEIAQLTATRDRLRALAASQTFDQPVKALTDTLQRHGVIGPTDKLRTGEMWAASVVDALHPEGMDGVLDIASALLTDSGTVARLVMLRGRIMELTDSAEDAEIDALAEEVADVLASAGTDAVEHVDLLDNLISARLTRSKRRFIDQLRVRLVGRSAAARPQPSPSDIGP
jgi:DNA-binding transcriptional MerR regulator